MGGRGGREDEEEGEKGELRTCARRVKEGELLRVRTTALSLPGSVSPSGAVGLLLRFVISYLFSHPAQTPVPDPRSSKRLRTALEGPCFPSDEPETIAAHRGRAPSPMRRRGDICRGD